MLRRTDDFIVKRGGMVHSIFSFLICFLLPKQSKSRKIEWPYVFFGIFKVQQCFYALPLDLAVFCRSLRDFILQHFFAVGVDGLDQEKLSPLLRLKYNDSMGDACRPRKTFRDKRRLRRISAFFVLGGPGLGE